jgi:RNA polymerase sigma factor FliA
MKAQLHKYQQVFQGLEERAEDREKEDKVLQYTPLIHFIVNWVALRLPPSVSREELISAGVVGLLDAVEKFDADRGIKFKTYAEHRIRGAMLDELRKMDWFPRSFRKDTQRVEDAILALETRMGREPEDWEVAKELGVGLDGYFKIIHRGACAGLLDIDDLNLEGDVGKRFGGLGPASPLERLTVKEIKAVVAEAVKGLSDMEQKVISLYYYDELTLKEIAKIFHLTESRICQIHSKAIVRLRIKLRTYHGS